MNRTKRYVYGLLSSYVVAICTAVVGLFLVPFTLDHLTREQFSIFTLATEVLMWLGLLELGIAAVLNVKAAQMSSLNEQEALNKLASTTFFAQCFIGILIIAVGTFIAWLFPVFFEVSQEVQQDARNLLYLLVLSASLRVFSQTFSAILIGYQQLHIDNAIRLILLFIRAALTILLLKNDWGLISLGLAHLFAVCVSAVLAIIRVHRLLPGLIISVKYFDPQLLKATAGTGIWFSVGGLAGILIMNVDFLVGAKLVGVEAITPLILTAKLYALGWTFIQQITNPARPALAQIIGAADWEKARAKYSQVRFLTMSVALVAVLVIWACNRAFLDLWVGPSYYSGLILDSLLALNLLVHAWTLPSRAILTAGLAYTRKNSFSRLVEGILNLSLSVILGVKFGLLGVVMATALAALCTTTWYLPYLTKMYFGTTLASLYKTQLKQLSLIFLVMLPSALVARWIGNVGGVEGVVAAATITGVAGIASIYLFSDKELRRIISAVFRRIPRHAER